MSLNKNIYRYLYIVTIGEIETFLYCYGCRNLEEVTLLWEKYKNKVYTCYTIDLIHGTKQYIKYNGTRIHDDKIETIERNIDILFDYKEE